MAEDEFEGEDKTKAANGRASPMPRNYFCNEKCYDGVLDEWRDCKCKGCGKKAHGRGEQYARDHGYLKYPPIGSHKTPEKQEKLFPEEVPADDDSKKDS